MRLQVKAHEVSGQIVLGFQEASEEGREGVPVQAPGAVGGGCFPDGVGDGHILMPYIQLGSKCIRYSLDDVLLWFNSKHKTIEEGEN